MASRAVQYRAPQYDVDASQQTYLVQKLRPVRDPRTMPKVVGGPDWTPAAPCRARLDGGSTAPGFLFRGN